MGRRCDVCDAPGAWPRHTFAWVFDGDPPQWRWITQTRLQLCLVCTMRSDVVDAWVKQGQAPDDALLQAIAWRGMELLEYSDGHWRLVEGAQW